MPKAGESHQITQGECLGLLCLDSGHADPVAVLAADENTSLRQAGRTPTQLAPGDVVSFPVIVPKWVTLDPGPTRHFYLRRRLTTTLRLELGGGPNGAWARVRYELETTAGVVSGETDADGTVDAEIPIRDTRVLLRLFAFPGWTEPTHEVELLVGHLDPADEVTGLQARLRALGFYDGAVDGVFGPKTEAGVRGFQDRCGHLEVDGIAGAETVAALRSVFGC